MFDSIGTRIKSLRESEKMTQMELAKILNCSVSIVSYWERDIKYPGSESLIKICKLFDVSADYLLGLKEI